MALALLILLTLTPRWGVQAQSTAVSLPDLRLSGSANGGGWLDDTSPHGALRLLGQEGFGDSWLELQSGSEAEMEASLTFVNKLDGRRVTSLQRLGAGGGIVVPMAAVPGISAGNWAAQVSAPAVVGAIARTRWPSGAAAGARSAESSRTLILPLMVIDAHGHSSIVTLMNSSPGAATQATLKVFQNDTGGPLVAVGAMLEPLGATSWDTSFERIHFGPSTLPRGASGGYVGAMWVEASGPVSMLSYGDEGAASGSSAIVARPQEVARREQHLPLLRGGPEGGSLVGVANASLEPNPVELRYFDLDGGLVATQRFEIAPRGAAALDLAGRSRGTVPDADLPAGFHGSATIEANKPILAAVQNETMVDQAVDTIAGYNGFSNDDLGTTIAVPGLRRTAQYVTSAIVVHNPHANHANVAIELHGGAEERAVTRQLRVPGRGTSILDLRDVEELSAGLARARIESDRSIAVLVRDTRDASVDYPISPITIDLREHDGSEVEGKARIMENENGFRVWIQMESSVTDAYQVAIHEGTCLDRAGAQVHELQPVSGGRPVTTDVRGDLRTIADGAHAIRLAEIDDRRLELQACGIVPWVRGVEVADEMLAEGIVIANEVAPTPISTVAPPTATAKPTATPHATAERGLEGQSTVYLPRAIR